MQTFDILYLKKLLRQIIEILKKNKRESASDLSLPKIMFSVSFQLQLTVDGWQLFV
ncbi:hypothetical protein Belba_2347 [Belliella baltica DSM 15883]|uniref:Uncharacterized protein n=1 Tax=Belliella baltica (strain DSM 15883 / CIP 108006 / LMG 21964 / BA134) TaxID=866536 RepID=I3Z6N9_BELBD|nr:hypothetical protein Belba_2347 [Belliella baltica DSM 15883]